MLARRRSAKAEMQALNAQLLLAEQLAGVGHWRLALPSRTLTWSAEIFRIFGFDPAGKVPPLAEVLAFYHPEDRDKVLHNLEAAITDSRAYQQQSRIIRPDGSIRHVESRGIVERGPDGNAVAFFGVFMDLTDRHAAEQVRAELNELSIRAQAAYEASRAKSDFLASMSHELRTPLNGILGSAELLRLEGGLNETQSVRLQTMIRAGAHLLQMISQVLDFSEIETGHVKLRVLETDPRELAQAALDVVGPIAQQAKNLRLGLSVDPDVPHRVVADPARLRQVLINLLGNAVKYTETGAVQLRVRRAEGEDGLGFDVADTGPGIDPSQRDRLFGAFDRLDISPLTAIEGAGLGLSIAANLVKLMGGRLRYEDNPGGGSVFRVDLKLPARLPADEASVSPDAGSANRSPLVPLRVLVVDDVDMNREIARAYLQAAGHRVICAGSGAEAVKAVQEGDFDAVLMDVRMPGMDGLEATRLIRSTPGARQLVPILAMTAQAFTEQVEACRSAGMNGHVIKPFTQDALLDALAELGRCGDDNS
jgi:PAS domain S-box-containing protein